MPLRSEEREILSVLLPFVSQYASRLYCNTPPICIAVLLGKSWRLWSPGCSPHDTCKANRQIVMKAVSGCWQALRWASAELREDYDIILQAASDKGCNGPALDRVTEQKNRPNRQKMSENCVFGPFGQFLDIFRTFFRHLSDILSTFPFSELSNDLPVTRQRDLLKEKGSLRKCVHLLETLKETGIGGGGQNVPNARGGGNSPRKLSLESLDF